MYWETPELLWLLPLVAGVALLGSWLTKRQVNVLSYWFGHAPIRRNGYPARSVLLASGLSVGIVGLAGPHLEPPPLPPQATEQHVYVVLDVSLSMTVQDVIPDRLTAAKRLIVKCHKANPGAEWALLIYAGDAYLQCPLTNDPEVFKTMLDFANPDAFADQSSNLRRALQLLTYYLTKPQTIPRGATPQVVVLTDGEHFGPTYQSVVNRLQRLAPEVFVVGVGTEAGGSVPNATDNAISRLATAELAQLTEALNGRYFSYAGARQQLPGLLRKSRLPIKPAELALHLPSLLLLLAFGLVFSTAFLLPTLRA